MDERPAELEAFARETRDLSAPPGARARVRAGVERGIARRRRTRLALAVGAPALAAAAAIAYFAAGTGEPGPVAIAAAEGVTRDGESVAMGERVAEGPVRIGAEGRLEASVVTGTVRATGPAALELARGRVAISDGEIEVDGRLRVEGPSCAADVDGRARVTAEPTFTQIVVIAGAATASEPEMACRILSLDAVTETPDEVTPVEEPEAEVAPPPERVPGASEPATASRDREPPPVRRRAAPRAPAGRPDREMGAPIAEPQPSPVDTRVEPDPMTGGGPSELAQQVNEYRAALALRHTDDTAALARFRAMQTRWPSSPLAHEVDLQVVDALVRLDRTAEARAEAQRFLRRHPSSPRAREIRAIAEANR